MTLRLDSIRSDSCLLPEYEDGCSQSSSGISTPHSELSYTSAGYRSVRLMLQRSSAIIKDTVTAERDIGTGIKISLVLAVFLSLTATTAAVYVTWVKVVTTRPICIQCEGRMNIADEFCCENLQSILQKIIEEHNNNSLSLPSTGIKIRRPKQVAYTLIGKERETRPPLIIPSIGGRLPIRNLINRRSMSNSATVSETYVDIHKTGKYLVLSYFDFSPPRDKDQTWDTYGHTVRRYNSFLPNDNTELLMGGYYTICVQCDSTKFDEKQNSYLSGVFLLKAGDKVYVSVTTADFRHDKNYLSVISIENRTTTET